MAGLMPFVRQVALGSASAIALAPSCSDSRHEPYPGLVGSRRGGRSSIAG